MPVTRGGAREVITDSPALKAIQEAGDALGRMGQLFNQTRQVRAYEKQIAGENADRFMAQAAGVYEKYASATDPAQAWTEMGQMLRSGLVAYGIDAGEVDNVFRKLTPLTEENINPMIVLSRALRRSMTGKGVPFEQAAGEEISTQRQEQMKEAAAAEGAVGKEPGAAPKPAASPSPLQQSEGLHVRYGQIQPGAVETRPVSQTGGEFSSITGPGTTPKEEFLRSWPQTRGTNFVSRALGWSSQKELSAVEQTVADNITAEEWKAVQAEMKSAPAFGALPSYAAVVKRLYREGRLTSEQILPFGE